MALGVSILLTPGGSNLAKQFRAWDGNWYLSIAAHGYPRHLPPGHGNAAQSPIAFFPVFPGLVRAVHVVTRMSLEKSGAFVVFAAGAAASVALWLLVRRLRDEDTADRAAALFVFFPGTIAFSLFYAEPLAVCFAILCCLFLLDRRWLLAGLCGAVATGTRPNAVVVVLAAFLAAVIAFRQRRSVRPFVAPLLAAAGVVGYFAFLWAWTGISDAWVQAQHRGWNDHFVFDQSLIDVRRWLRHPFHDVSLNVIVPTIIFAVIAVVLVVRTAMPVWLKAYAVVAVAVNMTSGGVDVRPRFLLMAFPIFLALADRARRSSLTVLVGGFAGLLTVYTVLMSTPLYPSP